MMFQRRPVPNSTFWAVLKCMLSFATANKAVKLSEKVPKSHGLGPAYMKLVYQRMRCTAKVTGFRIARHIGHGVTYRAIAPSPVLAAPDIFFSKAPCYCSYMHMSAAMSPNDSYHAWNRAARWKLRLVDEPRRRTRDDGRRSPESFGALLAVAPCVNTRFLLSNPPFT